MSNHTPGPWSIVATDNIRGVHTITIASDPCSLAVAKAESLSSADDYASKCSFDECYANAQLVAESPNLLETLKTAADYIEALGGTSKSYRSIIAKATGEAP